MVSLTEAQKKYYVGALKDAEEIVREAGWSRGTLMVSAIFEKIASPLFYVPAGEEKPEPPKPAPAAQPKPPAQPAGDLKRKLQS